MSIIVLMLEVPRRTCQDLRGAMKSLTKRQLLGYQYSHLNLILTPSRPVAVRVLRLVTGFSRLGQKVLEPNLVRRATGQYVCIPKLKADLLLRKGGPLALTDANLLLGRIIPDFFPKIFGESEKEPLDLGVSRAAFEKLREDINRYSDSNLSLDDVVYG
jgi:Hydantoinase/oxoprolinase